MMNQQYRTRQIRAEVERFWRESGIRASHATSATILSVEEARKIRELAWRFIEGDIALDEYSQLSASSLAQLSAMIQQFLSLRDDPTLIEIAQANPFYEPFPSKIIRDNLTSQKEKSYDG